MKKTLILALAIAATLTAGASGPQNLSPAARALVSAGCGMKRSAAAAGEAPAMVRAFLTFNSPEALDSVVALGGMVGRAAVPGIATVSVPVDAIERIASMPQVDYLEVGPKVKLLNDNVRSMAMVDALHDGSASGVDMPYTGKGVVVGIIDTGLEFNHIAFRDADGKSSRIRRVWEQSGIGRSPQGYGYGAEYVTPEEISGALYDSRDTYHATHVTGIAAGADLGLNRYYGMAPEADIVFVSFNETNAVSIADAIAYIFEYADEVDKPCVINMSLGAHQGPHDGTSAIDKTIDALTGPGRIVVGAVGNEGTAYMHIGKTFTDDDTAIKTMLAKSNSSIIGIDIWGEADEDITVKVGVINHLNGRLAAESKPITPTLDRGVVSFNYDATGADIDFVYYPSVTADNRANIYLEAYPEQFAGNKMAYVSVEGRPGSTVHMWNVGADNFTSGNRSGWSNGEQACSAGEIGGTARSIISVGSYNSCHTFYPYFDTENAYKLADFTIGAISDFSSKGPTADGRTKPDVLAGGQIVVSAVSQYASSEFNPNNCIDLVTDSQGRKYYYGLDAGTSMAAPVVTGVVALWLQAMPDLTPDDVRDCIRQSAIRDSKCGHVPNNQAGLGKIDAAKGMKLILQGKVGTETPEIAPSGAGAWVADGEICMVSPVEGVARVASLAGIEVLSAKVSADGLTSVSVSQLPHGIYVVVLPDGSATKLAL